MYSSHLRASNLNFFSTQLLLPATLPNLSSQWCPGRTCLSSCGDQSSRGCTHPHLSGLTFSSSLATILATLASRSRIPDDAVTVNSSSVRKVCLVCVQPCTMRFGPQEVNPCPRPHTREHTVNLYEPRSVFRVLVGSIAPVYLSKSIRNIPISLNAVFP